MQTQTKGHLTSLPEDHFLLSTMSQQLQCCISTAVQVNAESRSYTKLALLNAVVGTDLIFPDHTTSVTRNRAIFLEMYGRRPTTCAVYYMFQLHSGCTSADSNDHKSYNASSTADARDQRVLIEF